MITYSEHQGGMWNYYPPQLHYCTSGQVIVSGYDEKQDSMTTLESLDTSHIIRNFSSTMIQKRKMSWTEKQDVL